MRFATDRLELVLHSPFMEDCQTIVAVGVWTSGVVALTLLILLHLFLFLFLWLIFSVCIGALLIGYRRKRGTSALGKWPRIVLDPVMFGTSWYDGLDEISDTESRI